MKSDRLDPHDFLEGLPPEMKQRLREKTEDIAKKRGYEPTPELIERLMLMALREFFDEAGAAVSEAITDDSLDSALSQELAKITPDSPHDVDDDAIARAATDRVLREASPFLPAYLRHSWRWR